MCRSPWIRIGIRRWSLCVLASACWAAGPWGQPLTACRPGECPQVRGACHSLHPIHDEFQAAATRNRLLQGGALVGRAPRVVACLFLSVRDLDRHWPPVQMRTPRPSTEPELRAWRHLPLLFQPGALPLRPARPLQGGLPHHLPEGRVGLRGHGPASPRGGTRGSHGPQAAPGGEGRAQAERAGGGAAPQVRGP